MDTVSATRRSEIMRAIRGRGTGPELLAVREIRKAGLKGWRRHSKRVFGRPDFCWPKMKVAVFIDGVFWHGHPEHFRLPKTNSDFWREKIERNRRRDDLVNERLRLLGWRVVRIWDRDMKRDPAGFVAAVVGALGGSQ